jgi:uncharacterized protein YukJ
MEHLKDFLNDTQKNAISDYKYIPDIKIHDYKMKKGDYIKFMLKQNYQFMEGGIIINMTQYPIITLKSYQPNSQIYSIDLTKIYVFHKKNIKNQTQREYFEEYLKSLSKK